MLLIDAAAQNKFKLIPINQNKLKKKSWSSLLFIVILRLIKFNNKNNNYNEGKNRD